MLQRLGANRIPFGRFDLATDQGPLSLDAPVSATLAADAARSEKQRADDEARTARTAETAEREAKTRAEREFIRAEEQLRRAITGQAFEEAAKLRDKLRELKGPQLC